MRHRSKLILAAFSLSLAAPACATFSIVACDPGGACGAAVATNNLAVGATVIYAQARVGAVATQFETNPSYGPNGLALLQGGATARATVDQLVRTDDGFEGQDASWRQVGVVGRAGDGASYTGKEALAAPWAGSVAGPGFAIQGNGLAGEAVVAAMRTAFVAAKGALADRLLAAVEAGQAAGGQTSGRLSAALLVRTPDGGFQDIDLRVDAADQPLPELRRLLSWHEANDAIVRAERAQRRGKPAEAQAALAEAVRLGFGWDRIWRRAARLQMALGARDAAVQALAAFMQLNPGWARRELDDPLFAPLANDPAVAGWRSSD
jgi:uncharacterized Ntn-hydrolase superfamily protein